MKEYLTVTLFGSIAFGLIVLAFLAISAIKSGTDADWRQYQHRCAEFDQTVSHIATYDPQDAVVVEKYRQDICWK